MPIDFDPYIELFWRSADPLNEGNRIRGTGVPSEAIKRLEHQIGFRFPDEFYAFYGAANGLGLEKPLFVPIEELPRFISESRAWFINSHEQIAYRFFPFIDCDRSPTGYFIEDDGSLHPHMISMNVENYRDDPRFDPAAFMELSACSIREWLIG